MAKLPKRVSIDDQIKGRQSILEDIDKLETIIKRGTKYEGDIRKS